MRIIRKFYGDCVFNNKELFFYDLFFKNQLNEKSGINFIELWQRYCYLARHSYDEYRRRATFCWDFCGNSNLYR